MKASRTKAFLILAAALAISLVLGSGACLAVQTAPDTETPEEPPDTGGTDSGIYKATFAANIVAAFPELDLSIEAVESFRESGLGWGEIVIALSLASASGKTPDEVIAMAESGLGWGEVAGELGLDPKALGHAVSEVIGNADHGREKAALDEAAASALLESNFGLSELEITSLAEAGLNRKDLLMAFSATIVVGDSSTFETALTLRQESHNWQEVFAALGIDPNGVKEMRQAIQRSEIKEELREWVKAQKAEGSDKDVGEPGGKGKNITSAPGSSINSDADMPTGPDKDKSGDQGKPDNGGDGSDHGHSKKR